jgi:hypothetical protein
MIIFDKKPRLTIKKIQEYADDLNLKLTICKPSLLSPYVVTKKGDASRRLFEANNLRKVKAFLNGVVFEK